MLTIFDLGGKRKANALTSAFIDTHFTTDWRWTRSHWLLAPFFPHRQQPYHAPSQRSNCHAKYMRKDSSPLCYFATCFSLFSFLLLYVGFVSPYTKCSHFYRFKNAYVRAYNTWEWSVAWIISIFCVCVCLMVSQIFQMIFSKIILTVGIAWNVRRNIRRLHKSELLGAIGRRVCATHVTTPLFPQPVTAKINWHTA